jgi:eukaryotic-like serine/threonine-protein kinase
LQVKIFPRRGPEARELPATEFMSTLATLPPGAEPMAIDSEPLALDSQPVDSLPPDSQPALDSLPAPIDSAPSEPASNDGPSRPTAERIGRYAVRRIIANGGLGQVFEAWDPVLSRTVAIKTLQFGATPAERTGLDRLFLDEARAVARLSHPHIVTVFDAGLSANGAYIAMERLEGRDLREALAGGWRPSPARAAQLVRRIADALSYAHSHGVVHCDIKPANIYLTSRGKPKVLDFGIARLVQENGAVGELPSSFGGSIAGSPHYLAPEQWARGKIDARTDLYSLGVVFYELLAGRKAFAGDNLEQIRNAIEMGHPAPAHELRRDVPEALATIAARAMARDPAARYATAQEMSQALRRWLEHHHPARGDEPHADGATAGPPSRAAAAGPRHGQRWALALLLALALALAGLLWAGRGRQPVSPPALPAPAATVMPTAAAPPEAAPATAPAPESVPAAAAPLPAAPIDAVPAPAATGDVPAPPAADPARPKRTEASKTEAAAPRTRGGKPTPTVAAPRAVESAPAVAGTGVVQFAISPWGEIEVNGQVRGTAPPLASLELPLGSHSIVVRNTDFPAHTATVRISAEQPTTVRHRFVAP